MNIYVGIGRCCELGNDNRAESKRNSKRSTKLK